MISRNSPCPCGSGKRYKECCGAVTQTHPRPVTDLHDIMHAALAHQLANRLDEAERLYRQALTLSPDETDCLHMLGVVCLQTARPTEAVNLIFKAAELTGWRIFGMRHNLGLALQDALSKNNTYTLARRIAYRMWRQQYVSSKTRYQPLVSVIIPSYNHGDYIAECLRSVYGQTYSQIELIIIDDGSTDETPAIIENLLINSPFQYKFIARENRGAHATINEGVALAKGEYINILNSDDRFAHERIQRMVDEVAGTSALWGFANVQIINSDGVLVKNPEPGSRAADLEKILVEGPLSTTMGFGLLQANFAISTGNFFIARTFFQHLGGFSHLRYNHDWDFALRATRESEPVYVPEKLYLYRLHDHNTIAESRIGPKLEADELFHTYFGADDLLWPNPFAPCHAYWGNRFLADQCRLAPHLPGNSLKQLAQRIISGGAEETVNKLSSFTSLTFLEEQPEVARILDYIGDWKCSDAIPFDQTQRYGITAMAIERLRRPGQRFTILEVGANRHRRLGALLPMDNIVYLDMEIPEEMKGDADVIEGDATELAFPDGQFDVIVALDVLEHIPTKKRRDFLMHITRVASLMTIIAAPFASPKVSAAEIDACAYWNRLMSKPYRWLTEHADNGLPNLAETRSILTELGMPNWSIGHGRLGLWGDMIKGHFASEAVPELKPAMLALDEYYGKYLLARDFVDADCYRHFLFCSSSSDKIECVANHFSSLLQLLPPMVYADLDAIHKVMAVMHELAIEQAKTRNCRD